MNYLLRYFIKRVLENVIKRAKGSLNNIFQDKFNKILSQQSTDVRFFLSHNWIKRIKLKNKSPKHTHLETMQASCNIKHDLSKMSTGSGDKKNGPFHK